MIIGKFTQQSGGYQGFIETVSGKLELALVPKSKGADFDVVTGSGCDVGAAWRKTARESGKDHLSVQLDGPFFLAPINGAMFKAKDDSYQLVWDRKKPAPDA
jgi:uncharacterized protein (DUF736 family)